MPGRQFSSASYRYGFNGKEKQDELHGNSGDAYDFGARIYDARLGRWLSIDPETKSFAGNSPFCYALDSPIFLLDFGGQHPKVAIIIADAAHKYDFDDHVKALEAQGYIVVRVETGEQAIQAMKDNSTPESPIQSLVLLSHGSPGGLSNGSGAGIYTQMEIEDFAHADWYTGDGPTEYYKSLGVITDPNAPQYDEFAYETAASNYDAWAEQNWPEYKNAAVEKYKQNTGARTAADVGEAMQPGNGIEVENLKIVIGGCNTAGKVPPDTQDIFAKELAVSTKATTVYASEGYTQPDQSQSYAVSVAGNTARTTISRASDGQWVKCDQSGNKLIPIRNQSI